MTERLHQRNVDQRVAEDIARAQEMLGRLDEREVYEPNYTGEKLWDAAAACIHALALVGQDEDDVRTMAADCFDRGVQLRARIERR